ncbi:MAG: TRIC cation channel family protein [Clostridia bacterium]|nr:TRIC cation channel family protein [Clostridia bacterium]
MDTFVLILELIGTVAFAASGAIVAVRKKMDIFGVAVLALVTAVGGGMIRDVLLGVTPPNTFRDPIYAVTAIAVSLVVFIRPVRHYLTGTHAAYQRAMLVMDSLGLGVFTAVGVSLAYGAQPDAGIFLSAFVGVLSGVGGGILRDVLAGDTPYIFIKHIYACASLAGALACSLLWRSAGQIYAMIAGASLVVLIRILSAIYKWNLPRAD